MLGPEEPSQGGECGFCEGEGGTVILRSPHQLGPVYGLEGKLGNRTTRRQTNSRSVKSRTGQLAD